jgi:ribosomal protein L16/L10AE
MYSEDILYLPKVVHGYVWYYPYISMRKHANFHMVFEYYSLYRVGSGMGYPKYLLSYFLEDILCLPIVVHGYVWYYPYISMWKHANFHVVFDYNWLCRVGSGMGDPKYLLSYVFGRYFLPTNS